ncbi:MAG TPA: sugar transferase [Clostridia bacterium]|nr:sugar transferase [Clostridia bacterium]
MELKANKAKDGKWTQGLPLWKRGLDLGLIALLAPGMLLCGLVVVALIKLGSPGPIFFMQKRVGCKGREFRLFKFRTMKVNAETDSHRNHARQLIHSKKPMTKLDAVNDPRLIPLGGFLRSTGLDELPQVLNVLRGEMSLVGPRPCIPYEYELYEPWQRERLRAVPGLTGLWQVSGKNRTTFEEMVRLDIEYADRKTFWLDLKIIAKTFPALWTQWQDQRAPVRTEPSCDPASIAKTVQSSHL